MVHGVCVTVTNITGCANCNCINHVSRKQLKRDVSLNYPSLSSQDLDSIFPSKAVVHCVQYESGKDGSVSSYYALDDIPILFCCGSNVYPSGELEHAVSRVCTVH